jgi:hypothetical protein
MRLQRMQPNLNTEPGPAHIEALMVCVHSGHALLDLFLSMDTFYIRTIPTIAYTRVLYSLALLLKLDVCTQTPSISSIGRALSQECLKIDYYLDMVMKLLGAAAGPGRLRVPSTFLSILVRLTAWRDRQIEANQDCGSVDRCSGTQEKTTTCIDQFSQNSFVTDSPWASRTGPLTSLESYPLPEYGNIFDGFEASHQDQDFFLWNLQGTHNPEAANPRPSTTDLSYYSDTTRLPFYDPESSMFSNVDDSTFETFNK